MIHPLKAVGKAVPTMFKYFSFFIIVTLCSFFSCIQFMKPVSPSGEGSAIVSTPFEEFIMNMMSFSNIDTDFSLGFNNAETNLMAQGNVVYDASGKMSVDVDFVYNEQSFNLDVKYLTPYLYMSVTPQESEVTTYKFDLTSQEQASGGTMDFGGLVDFIKANINFDTSKIDKFISSIGFANDNNNGQFELEDLLMKQSERRDGGYEFILGLKIADKTISIQILCDEDYNIESITLRNAAIYETAISFGATVNNMNNDHVSVDYKETGEEVNMTGLTTFTGYAKNLFAGNMVEGDVTLNLTVKGQQKTYDAKLYTDTNRVKLVTEIEGIALELAYEDEMIFLSADGLKVKFDVNDYGEWKDKINYLLEEYAGKDIAQVLQEAVDKFIEKHDLGNIDLGTKLLEIVHGGFENVDAVNEFLPSTAQFNSDGTIYSMQWTDGTTAVLTQENEMLKNIEVSSVDFDMSANFSVVEETYSIEQEAYFNLSTLLPLADVVDKFVQNGRVGGEITLSYKDATFKGDYVIDFEENVVAKIHMGALGEDAEIFVTENEIMLKLGEIVISGSVEEIQTYLQRVDAIFGTEYEKMFEDAKASDTQKAIALLSDTLKKLSISSSEESLAVISYLSVIANVEIVDDDVVLTMTYGDEVTITVGVSTTEEKVSLPKANSDATSLLDKIENVMSYINGDTFAFTISGNYKDQNFDGFVQVEMQDKQVQSLKVALNDNIEVVYIGGTAYIKFNSNKIQINTNSIQDIVKIVKNIALENGYQQSEVDYGEILEKVFGENIKELTIGEFLDRITLKVNGNLQSPSVHVEFAAENALALDANIVFENDDIRGATLTFEDGQINAEVAAAQKLTVNGKEYYNLSTQQSGTLTLTVTKDEETLDIPVKIQLDLTDKIYVNLSAILFGQEIEFVLLNDKASVKIGEVYFAADLNNAKDLYDAFIKMFDVKFEGDFDKDDLAGLTDKFDFTFTGMQARFSSKVNDNFKISVVLNDEQNFKIILPHEGEELIDILPTAKKIMDYVLNKQFAFEFSVRYNKINLSGVAHIDVANQIYDISGLVVGGQTLAIRYQNSQIFMALGENKFKVKAENAGSLYDIINKIIKANNLPSVDILQEIFGQDITKLTIKEWLSKIVLNAKGDLNKIQLSGSIDTKKPATYNVNIKFEDDCFKNISAWISNKLYVYANVIDYAVSTIDEDEFLDLASTFSGKVDVVYTIKGEEEDKDINLSFDVAVDLVDKIYVNLSTTILDTKIELVVLNEKLYLTIGGIAMTQSFNNAKEMFDYVIDLFEIVLKENDGGLLDQLKTLDLNSFEIAKIVDIAATNSTLHVGYNNETLRISADLKQDSVDTYIAPEKCEYLASFLPKIKNIVDLVNSKQFAFDFTFNYTTDGKIIPGLKKSLASFALDGSVSVDLNAGVYGVYIDNLAGSNFAAVFKDNVLYIDYLDNKIKLQKAALENLVPIITELVAVNKVSSGIESATIGEKLVEMFGEDLSKLSLEEIIKKFSVTLSGNTQDILVNLLFNTPKPKSADISVTFGQEGTVASWNPNTFENTTEKKLVGDNLSGISLSVENYALQLNMKDFEEIDISGDYYDLTTSHSGDVAISIGFAGEEDVEYVDINAKVDIDLSDKIYLKVSGTALDEDFEVVVLAQLNEEDVEEETVKVLYGGVYVKFGEITLSEKLDNLYELYNQISSMFTKEEKSDVLDLGALDVAQKLTDIGLSLSIKGKQQVESKVVPAQISVTYTKGKISVGDPAEEKDKIIVKAQLTNSTVTVDDTFTAPAAESLLDVMPKVKNIYSYTQKTEYGFRFDFAYNDGFNISGNLKLNKMSEKHEDGKVENWTEVEITGLEIFGTEAYLRIHKKDLYLAYSNTKIHVSLENDKDKDKQPKDIFAQLDKIMGKDFDVQLRFGVFEDLLKMITECRKSVPAYYSRLSLLTTGSTDNIALSFTKDKVENNVLLSANVVFKDKNSLPTISANLRGIMDVGVTILTGDNKIGDFDSGDTSGTAFGAYSTDYMDAITKSLQLYKNSSVYSFTSHMSVRYVQTLIEGDLTVLLLDTNTKTAKNKEIYKPMLALTTEAMNLTVRIYLVDGTLYLDADGLLIKADVTLENVKNIIAFVNSKFMAADSQIVIEDSLLQKIVDAVNSLVFDFEGEKDESGETKFRPIMPSFDKFTGQWTEDEKGIIIGTKDALQYKENAKFTDLVLKLLVKTDENGTILPTEVVFGANIDDPNTISHAEKEEAKRQETAEEKKFLPCEEPLTKELNFAVYLENIFVGSEVTTIADNFTFEENTNKVNGLRSVFDGKDEHGTEAKVYNSLSDYQDYQVILDMVSAAYDYYQSKEYQLGIDELTIEGDTSRTKISQTGQSGETSVRATIGELAPEDKDEEEHAKDGFLDFTIDLQSDLMIENFDLVDDGGQKVEKATTKHKVDIFYKSHDYENSGITPGLYLSYLSDNYKNEESKDEWKQDNNIEHNVKPFRAKIANSNLSDIMAMVLNLMKLDIGEDMQKTLGLTDHVNTTDFTFLQSLLKIKERDESETFGKASKYLNEIASITKMVHKLTFEKTLEGGVNTFVLTVEVDLLENGTKDGAISVYFKEANGAIQLDRIELVDLILKAKTDENGTTTGEDKTINATIGVQDFSKSTFTYDTTQDHFDFSEITGIVDTLANTLNQQDVSQTDEDGNDITKHSMHYHGDATVTLIGSITISVPFDIEFSIDANKDISLYVELFPGPMGNDLGLGTYRKQDTGMKIGDYTGHDKYINRTSVIEYRKVTQKDIDARDELTQKDLDQYRLYIKQSTIWDHETEAVCTYEGTWYLAWTDRKYEKVAAYTPYVYADEWMTLQTAGDQFMTVLAKLLGLTTGVSGILEMITIDARPSIEKLITSFSYSGGQYKVGLNGKNLTGMKQFEDFTLDLTETTYSNPEINPYATFKFIESIATENFEMTGVKIALSMASLTKDIVTDLADENTYKNTYKGQGNVDVDCTGHVFHTNKYYRDNYIRAWTKAHPKQ